MSSLEMEVVGAVAEDRVTVLRIPEGRTLAIFLLVAVTHAKVLCLETWPSALPVKTTVNASDGVMLPNAVACKALLV